MTIAVTITITVLATLPSPLRLTNTWKMLNTLITHSHAHNHITICPKWVTNAGFGHRKRVTTCLPCTHMTSSTTRRAVTTVRVLTNWTRKSWDMLLAFNSTLQRSYTSFHTTTHNTFFHYWSRQQTYQLFHAHSNTFTSHINQSVTTTCSHLLTSIVLSMWHQYLYLLGTVHIIHLQALKHITSSSSNITTTSKNNRLALPIDMRVQLPQKRHTQNTRTIHWQYSKAQ